jgi:hypothetical protein
MAKYSPWVSIKSTRNALCRANHYRAAFFMRKDKKHMAKIFPCAYRLLTVKIRQPSHEFTFGVGMNFIPYPLVLTPVV